MIEQMRKGKFDERLSAAEAMFMELIGSMKGLCLALKTQGKRPSGVTAALMLAYGNDHAELRCRVLTALILQSPLVRLDEVDANNATLLHRAFGSGSPVMVEMLMGYVAGSDYCKEHERPGIPLNQVNKAGKTVLDVAENGGWAGKDDIFKRLKAAGASSNPVWNRKSGVEQNPHARRNLSKARKAERGGLGRAGAADSGDPARPPRRKSRPPPRPKTPAPRHRMGYDADGAADSGDIDTPATPAWHLDVAGDGNPWGGYVGVATAASSAPYQRAPSAHDLYHQAASLGAHQAGAPYQPVASCAHFQAPVRGPYPAAVSSDPYGPTPQVPWQPTPQGCALPSWPQGAPVASTPEQLAAAYLQGLEQGIGLRPAPWGRPSHPVLLPAATWVKLLLFLAAVSGYAFTL